MTTSNGKRGVLDSTADSVGSAIDLLWNWLTADPPPGQPEREPSLLDLIPDGPPKLDGRIPAEVVDTRPEETGPIDTTGEGRDDGPA